MTAWEAGTGMAATEALAARWWLEERRAVDLCQLVLTVEVSSYVGSSCLTVYSQNCKRIPRCCCALSSPMTEATEDGWKC